MEEDELAQFGVADVLYKPVTMASLRQMLHKWLPSASELSPALSKLCLQGGHVDATDVCGGIGCGKQPTRILHVEDCLVAARAVEHICQALGFWVDTVYDGEAAMVRVCPYLHVSIHTHATHTPGVPTLPRRGAPWRVLHSHSYTPILNPIRDPPFRDPPFSSILSHTPILCVSPP